MTRTRSYRKLLFAATLLLLAGLMPQPEAQAKSMQCCCSGEACQCCCCASKHSPKQTNMLPGNISVATGDCSCSSGPNPYGRDATTCAIAAEHKKKRHIQHNAALSCSPGASCCSTSAPADKPPPRTVKCLYLLHRSLLI